MNIPVSSLGRWAITSALLIILALSACRRNPENPAGASIRTVTISAHRGGPASGYPENALETLRHTVELIDGVMLEVDVRQTRDRQLVLMHDRTLDRTTTFKGPLRNFTLEELSSARLVDMHGQIVEMGIPTLERVFEWLRDTDAFLSLDIKDNESFDPVIELVRSYGVSERVELITYNISDAIRIHGSDPELYLSVSIGSRKALTRFLESGISPDRVSAFTGLNLKDAEFYKDLREAGVVVTLGTLGNLDRRAQARGDELYAEWKNLGIDRFATDRPFAVDALRRSGKLSP